jgi:Raf kinase inhibitor-like YbhB/YbcL family protein
MLEKLPSAIGRVLRQARPGVSELTYNDASLRDVPESIRIESSAFSDGGEIPEVYTADGDSMSPPLVWTGVPDDTEALVLLVEDADSPTPNPLVHAIVWDLPPLDGKLRSGELSADSQGDGFGRNSLLQCAFLPIDPPRAHGPHHYAFQLFALDTALDLEAPPGRGKLLELMHAHVLAKGCLMGTYERT